MGVVPTDFELERAAHSVALESVRSLWADDAPVINPNTRVSSLSTTELDWIVSMAITKWIVERARQATTLRVSREDMIKTAAGKPEPWEMGTIKATLPVLGDVIEDLGVNDRPVGAWSVEEIGWFVWSCFKVLEQARTARDETPSEIFPPHN